MEYVVYNPETIIMFWVIGTIFFSIVTFVLIDEFKERRKYKKSLNASTKYDNIS